MNSSEYSPKKGKRNFWLPNDYYVGTTPEAEKRREIVTSVKVFFKHTIIGILRETDARGRGDRLVIPMMLGQVVPVDNILKRLRALKRKVTFSDYYKANLEIMLDSLSGEIQKARKDYQDAGGKDQSFFSMMESQANNIRTAVSSLFSEM